MRIKKTSRLVFCLGLASLTLAIGFLISSFKSASGEDIKYPLRLERRLETLKNGQKEYSYYTAGPGPMNLELNQNQLSWEGDVEKK